MKDDYNLQRFVEAQEPVFQDVCDELAAGQKTSHWMWFIFPQYRGLGHSSMAQRFAIQSMGEAHAYLSHPVLGPRLLKCSKLMLPHSGKSATGILGTPDDMKFHSSMTLFAVAKPEEAIFKHALAAFYSGKPDVATLALLDEPVSNMRTPFRSD